MTFSIRNFSTIAAATAVLGMGLSSPALADDATEIRGKLASAQISLLEAIDKGAAAAPGKVIDIELDRDDGVVRYELEVVNAEQQSIELAVDIASGEVLTHKHDGKASRRDLNRLEDAKIDIKQAVQAAVQHNPGTPYAVQLDSHWGKTTYEVDILQADGKLLEVKVDAATGEILRTKED